MASQGKYDPSKTQKAAEASRKEVGATAGSGLALEAAADLPHVSLQRLLFGFG